MCRVTVASLSCLALVIVSCGGGSGSGVDQDVAGDGDALFLEIPDGCPSSYIGECPFDPEGHCPCLCVGTVFSPACGIEFQCFASGEWQLWDEPACTTFDQGTGLRWQDRLPASAMTWQAAVDYCAANPDRLPGEGWPFPSLDGWRLPAIDELRTLVGGCPASETGGVCGVTADCLGHAACASACAPCVEASGGDQTCYGHEWLSDSYSSPRCREYWSASPDPDAPGEAWLLDFSNAAIAHAPVTEVHWVACVRGPAR
jgi:hypothetical protein